MEDTGPQPEQPRIISLLEFNRWFMSATTKSPAFLVKPKDLHTIYTLILWECLSSREDTGPIESDGDIKIPEKNLIRIVETVLNKNYNPLFKQIADL